MPDLRAEIIRVAQAAVSCGLMPGVSGNVSCRADKDGTPGFYITPSGMAYERLMPDDIPWVSIAGEWDAEGPRPSSEWRLHRDLYARPDAGAVLHAHSPYATALACLNRAIPPFHYMIARFGGDTIRCAPYAPFGTQALSEHAMTALQNRSACLLANHGMVVYAPNPAAALALGQELETLCQHYALACQIGEPALLGAEEMADALLRFKDYATGKG
ncbi:MAG: class II aldolase/adducin family protein [Betaproteobacteria bacterium]|nr:class II aldolase/adducin family protein [Betaproteobacteria bacterium]